MIIEEILIILSTCLLSFIIFYRIKRISIVSSECIFLLFFFFYCVLGSLILLLGLDSKRLNDIYINYDILLKIWMYCSISIVIIITILILFKRGQTSAPLVLEKKNIPGNFTTLLITGIICLISIYYIISTDSPIYLLLKSGNIVEAFYARQTEVNDSGFFKEQHIKFITNEISFYWTLYLFCNYIYNKKYKTLFFISFIILSITLASNLSKGGVVFLIASLGILYLFKKNKKLTFSWIFSGTVLIVSVATIIQYYLLPTDGNFNLLSISGSVLSRITTGQLAPAYYVIEYIKNSDFLYGTTLPNPKSILPFTFFDLETKTWELMNSYRSSIGLTYKNPTVFWADAYANFGLFGVILYSCIVGFILVTIDTIFLNKKEITLPSLALLVYLSFHYARLSGKALGPFFWDLNLLSVLVFYFMLNRLTKNNE
ncbi:O-antigen polymerase [Providencia sp. SKLX074055]|uniref:O-antigen polymerase n=1 Tax=Providencia xihuensis TaxID=3342830 RepID=UPI0035BEF16F